MNALQREQKYLCLIYHNKKDISDLNEYFDLIYESNLKVNSQTLRELEEELHINTNGLKNNDIIRDNVFGLNFIRTQLESYHIEKGFLIIEFEKLLILKNKCEFIIEEGEILFYSDDCILEYNNIVRSIESRIQVINKIILSLEPGKDIKTRMSEFSNIYT